MILSAPLDGGKVCALRGIVDVYQVNGQTIARKWPKRPVQPNTPAQVAARVAFAATSAYCASQAPEVSAAWRASRSWTGRSWLDIWRSCVYPLAATGPIPETPVIKRYWRVWSGDPNRTRYEIEATPAYSGTGTEITWLAAVPPADGSNWLVSRTVKRWCRSGVALRVNVPSLQSYLAPFSSGYFPSLKSWYVQFRIPDQPLTFFPTRKSPLAPAAPMLPPSIGL